MSPSHHCLVGA